MFISFLSTFIGVERMFLHSKAYPFSGSKWLTDNTSVEEKENNFFSTLW